MARCRARLSDRARQSNHTGSECLRDRSIKLDPASAGASDASPALVVVHSAGLALALGGGLSLGGLQQPPPTARCRGRSTESCGYAHLTSHRNSPLPAHQRRLGCSSAAVLGYYATTGALRTSWALGDHYFWRTGLELQVSPGVRMGATTLQIHDFPKCGRNLQAGLLEIEEHGVYTAMHS